MLKQFRFLISCTPVNWNVATPSATIQVGIPGEIRALLRLHHCEVESIVNQHCSALLGTENELFNVSVNCQNYTTVRLIYRIFSITTEKYNPTVSAKDFVDSLKKRFILTKDLIILAHFNWRHKLNAFYFSWSASSSTPPNWNHRFNRHGAVMNRLLPKIAAHCVL